MEMEGGFAASAKIASCTLKESASQNSQVCEIEKGYWNKKQTQYDAKSARATLFSPIPQPDTEDESKQRDQRRHDKTGDEFGK